MTDSAYESTNTALFGAASAAIDRASLSAARIGSGRSANLKESSFSFTPATRTSSAPPQFSDLFAGVDKGDTVVADLNSKVDAWLAKYFPAVNSTFKGVPEDWLVGVIGGTRPFGIESTLFDMIWHQARDRAARTTRSEQRTLAATFSARGFSIPPGALVDAITQSEQRATDAALDVNREQAMKDAEIKADILKHAVTLAAQLRTNILSASAEFFKAYHSVYAMDNDTARIRAQAYQTYYSALASHNNVEVAWEQIRLAAAEKKADIAASIDRNRVALYGADGASGAHAQASRGFADIAASAVNAAGTLVAQVESI